MEIPAANPLAQSVTTAIRTGDIPALTSLLNADPELATARIIDPKNGSLRTLLHIATDWPGHFPNVAQTIALLIANRADPNLPLTGAPNHQETPLHWAASSNDVAAIDALLDGRANIEAPGAVFTGGTAMSDAVIFACWDAARRLLQRGAQTNMTQSAGLGLIDRLTAHFAQQPKRENQEITGALWHACRGGHLPAVQFLIGKGANFNWLGWDHMTPLDGAIQSKNTTLIAWLRETGAKTARELAA